MKIPSINTRDDLDAIVGTPEHVAFMALLAGTLWRVEKDDTAQAWVAIEDNSTIERFNFTRADFPDAQPPALPEYVPVVDPVPEVVTMRQARLALLGVGMLAQIDAAVAGIPGQAGEAARIEWEFGTHVARNSDLVKSFGLTNGQVDEIFAQAGKL